MKKTKFITIFLAIFCAFSLSIGLFGCANDNNQTFNFELVKTNVKIDIDDSYQIFIKGGQTEGITYVSENPQIASVNADGLVTGENQGETKINVTINDTTKACTIQVVDSGERPHIQLYNVPSDESLRLLVDDEYEIDSAILFKRAEKNVEVSFSSSDTSKVAINGNKIKAISVGSSTIKASATYRGWQAEATFVVEVVEDVVVYMKESNIELSYSDITGQSTEYTISTISVSVDGQKLDSPVISWFSSDNNVASVVNGKITANNQGSAKISAVYNKNGVDYLAYLNVSVVDPYLSSPVSISYDKNSTTISWDEVDYADGYVVNIDGKEINVSTNKFVLGIDGAFFGEYIAKIKAVSNNSLVVDSQYSNVEVLVDTIVLDERLKPKDSYIDASIFEEKEYNLVSGQKVYSVIKGDDDPFYDGEQFGYMFRKLYYTPDADKASSISGWTNSAIIGVNEQVSRYKKATISFWAYAENETTFRLLYTDMGKDKSVLGETKIPAQTWTRVVFDFASSKTFKFLSFISSTGDFSYTDMRINLSSYVSEDFSNCTFPLNNDYRALNLLIDYIKDNFNENDLQPSDYHIIYGAMQNYEKLSSTDKSKLVDYSYIENLNSKFNEKYDVEILYGATEAENGVKANTAQKGEAGATLSYMSNLLYGPIIDVVNVGGVQQRLNIIINENIDKKYEGYKFYFNIYSTLSKNIAYVNENLVWTDANGQTDMPIIPAGEWTSYEIDSFKLGLYKPEKEGTAYRHIGMSNITNGNGFKISAVFAIRLSKVSQLNKTIGYLTNKSHLEPSDYHAIYGIKTTYQTLSNEQKSLVDYNALIEVETKFLKMYEVKVVYAATEAENGISGDGSNLQAVVSYETNYVYGNVVKLTSPVAQKIYAKITKNNTENYSGYDIYYNIYSDVSSNITYWDKGFNWVVGDAINIGNWTSFALAADSMNNNSYRVIGINSMSEGGSFSLSTVFAIRALYLGDGKVVFGDTLASKGITAESSDTWTANETISTATAGTVINENYTYNENYGDVVRIDITQANSGNKFHWAVRVNYQSILDAINVTGADSVTVNIWSNKATYVRFGGFANGAFVNLSNESAVQLNIGWNEIVITKADIENIISKGVSMLCKDDAPLPLTLLVSDFTLNYTE